MEAEKEIESTLCLECGGVGGYHVETCSTCYRNYAPKSEVLTTTLDFTGEWKLVNELRAVVISKISLGQADKVLWVGDIVTPEYGHIRTIWDHEGNNVYEQFNLKSKRRGEEEL